MIQGLWTFDMHLKHCDLMTANVQKVTLNKHASPCPVKGLVISCILFCLRHLALPSWHTADSQF